MIDFQNVSFSYGEESSGGGIRNVNLTINTGEFVLLTGESGCGKTTLLRILGGFLQADQGEVLFGKRAGASLLRR